MRELNNDELTKLNGGGLSLLSTIGIVGAVVFLIGVFDGYVRPMRCNT